MRTMNYFDHSYKYNVSIALCTFNGSPYLKEQLASLMNQAILPAELIICDDRSADQSVETVKAFAAQAPFPVVLYENETRLGPVQNFSKALSLCSGDYVAPCDQDDIWFADKLSKGLAAMAEAEKEYGVNFPLLIHTDLAVVDSAGKPIASSFMKLQNLKPCKDKPLRKLIVQNYVTGSTVLVNRALLDLALPIPEEALMHDWWLALVAAATGQIVYNENPTVFYRQHNQNVVGASSYYSKNSLNKILNIALLENELAGAIKQLKALQYRLAEIGVVNRLEDIKAFVDSAENGGMKAFNGALKSGMKATGLVRNFVLYLLLLKGGYIDRLNPNLFR